MQDQQVRRSCNAIATQLLLSALPNAPATRPNSSTADHAVTKGEGDDRTRALRRLCETVVSDAMTLYRLCHRAGGAETRIVVLGSSSSSTAGGGGGGGGGSGNLVEEAAFCVCATIMAREPKLWSSLLRRAQLLRPRRPTLTFAVPVVVAPIVVADVVKFFGRSRHLVPAGVSRGVGLCSAAGAVTVEGESGTGGSTGGDGGVLSDQQAEAVAASFFFKTMTVAERQRRPEVLSIELPSSRHKAAGASSAAPPASAAVPGLAPAAASASPSPPPPLTAAATAREAGVATGYGAAQRLMLAAQAAQPSRRRTARAAAASSTVGSALLAHDDWAGWGRAGDPFHADGRRPRGVTEQGQAAGGRDWGVHERSSSGRSSSDSSDDDRSVSSGDGGATRRGDRHQTRSGGELAANVSTHHRKQRKTQAAEAAVLERLYHLATAAEDKEEEEEEEGDDEGDGAGTSASGSAQGKVDGGGAGASGRPGLYSTAAAASTSTSLFASGGRHLGMVALAAMTAQVQDELHWGRLTALVRCPLLFRGLTAPTLLPHAGLPSASCGVALSPTSEMLSAGTLAHLANALGDAYSSAASATESAPSAFQSTGTEGVVQASLDALLSRFGSAGSFFCPARLRTSSLLPRPPSLVTDGFLWTRLLICAAWLTVYANGLVDSTAAPPSGAAPSSPRRSARTEKSTTAAIAGEVGKMKRSAAVRPRIRSSPLVRELVTYCVAVVREARAISAARTDAGEAHSVCCPVCDRLIKEQQPILWWSTLRDDRALLRRHVSTLLESGSSTAAEAEVSAAVAADGVWDRRGGGRAYAAPLLRGSRAAGEQVAALQEQWAAYIMSGPQSGGGAAATNAGEASAPTSRSNQRGDSESAATLSPDGATPMPTPQTEVVWAALTQRVAAAADLCAFLATHPLSSVEAAAAQPSRSMAANVGRQRVVSRRGRRGGGGGDDDRQRRKRARRATSSDSSPTSSDEESDGDEDSVRIAADRTDGESGGAAAAHHTRDEELGTSRSWGGPPAAPSHHGGSSGGAAQQGGRNTDRGSGTAQGSRHATAVAAEWEALLRRCGWVNAAPPRQPLAPPNSSAVAGEAAAATAPSAAPAERSSLAAASSSAASPEARLCSSWARSLIQPTAMPNAAQAAVLRRRLSRYRLHDVVRILVLGRGVEWERYAALLFGEDAVVGHPPRSMANNASSPPPHAVAVAVAAAPQRAGSMSLLLDDSTVDGSACVAGRAEERRRSLLSPHDRQRLSPDLLGNSAPPPPQQQQREPHESLSTSPRPSAQPDAATTPRKSALLSIPLHVSPLKRHAGAVASTQHTAVRDDGHGPEEGSQEAEGRTGSPSPTLSTQQQTAASQVCRHDGRRASSLPTQEEGGSPAVGCDASFATPPSAESDGDDDDEEEEALAEAQLRDQQTALRALLDFCPRFPPLREEDGVLECGSCFSLFHQDCIAPVQRDLIGQVFLCHTCRLRWARPCVTSGAGGGLIHQAQEQPR